MGKARKWIKNLLCGKKDKQIVHKTQTPSISIAPAIPKEKRRWRFRRSSATTPPITTITTNSTPPTPIVHEVENYDQKKQALEVAFAAAATAIVKHTAATRIQSVFRSYLARKALCALKRLVKLQALVRGHLVRKRATATLRYMQALVTIQGHTCAQRRWSNDGITNYGWPDHSEFYHGIRDVPEENIIYHGIKAADASEENIKIVELDTRSTRTRNSNPKERVSMHISPAPSESSPRASRSHFEDFAYGTTQSGMKHDYAESLYEVPSYMANTKSSRAKARSHSAPKQRLADRVSSVYERQSSSVSRRGPSIEARNVPRAEKMQRSSSHLGPNSGGQNNQYPWSSVKLDRSTASLIGSECGSTSTVLTNVNYCQSLIGFDTNHRNEY